MSQLGITFYGRIVVSVVLLICNMYAESVVAVTKNLLSIASNADVDSAADNVQRQSASPLSYTRAVLNKTHGFLMVLSWMLISSVSLILARYFRRGTFVNLTVGCMWTSIFKVHNVLMYVSAFTMLAAFLVISPWLSTISSASRADYMHVVSGCAVLVEVWLMVAMGTYAPKGSSSWRPLFNVTHRICGKVIQLFAAGTMIVGYCSPLMTPSGHLPGCRVVLAWYTALFLLELTLDLFTAYRYGITKKYDSIHSKTDIKWPTYVFFTYVFSMIIFFLAASYVIFM